MSVSAAIFTTAAASAALNIIASAVSPHDRTPRIHQSSSIVAMSRFKFSDEKVKETGGNSL